MKRKLGIAPFLKTCYPLVTCELPDYEIQAAISPRGFGIDGKDLSVLRNRAKLGICGTSNIEAGYNMCDVILIPNIGDLSNRETRSTVSRDATTIREYTIRALDEAIMKGKDILCFAHLDKDKLLRYKHMCESENVKFSYFEQSRISDGMYNKFKQINVPVVFIGETSRDCDGYEIFLKLIQSFNIDNRKVLALSEEKYNILYNQYSVSFWNHNDPMTNILNINNYVAELASKTKPDVILIKLPEPMTKFDNNITFDFGVTAFLLSQALPADYFIYCSYSSLINPEMMVNMSENFISKFGYQISAIHISNQITDFSEDNKDDMQTLFLNRNGSMKDIRDETGVMFYNLNDEADFDLFYSSLCCELFDITYGVITL